MASEKVSATITFFHEGTIPPVYLAGSFSQPPWNPEEMEYTVDNGQHRFTKEVELEPEVSYQYKFRLGHEGDWWVLDEATQKDTDAAGNTNNVITAPKAEPVSKPVDLPSPPASESHKSEQEVPVPTLIVERADEKPAYGDDFGSDATAAQRDAHEKRLADAEPDYTIVHNDPSEEDKEKAETADEVADSAAVVDGETPLNPKIRTLQGQSDGMSDACEDDKEKAQTADDVADSAAAIDGETLLNPRIRSLQGQPERTSTPIAQVAATAAEVADTAAALDREPTPQPSSDEEAGRTGERRMSGTPIQEVADTAAEVADSAAAIDRDLDDDDDDSRHASGIATPAEDKAPMFAYEFVGEVDSGQEAVPEGEGHEHEPTPEFENADDVDLNDPTIEKFPEDREGILSKIKTSQSSLSPDETRFEGVPLSPVVGPSGSPMSGRGISESPISPMHKASAEVEEVEREPTPPALDAIEEDEEEPDTDEQAPVVKIIKSDTMTTELDARLAAVDVNGPLSLEAGGKSMPPPGSFSGISAPLNTAQPTPGLDMLDRLHGGILSGGPSSRGADGNTPLTGEEKKLSVSHLSSVSEDVSSAPKPSECVPEADIEEQKLEKEIESKKQEQYPSPKTMSVDVPDAVKKAQEYGKTVGAQVADVAKNFEAQVRKTGSELADKVKQAAPRLPAQVDGGRSVSESSNGEPDTDAVDSVTGQHIRLDGSNDTATSSAIDVDEHTQLIGGKIKKRKDAQLSDRPPSAQSLRPASDEAGKPTRGWLRSIWNTVVIGWFGALLRKLGLTGLLGGTGALGERAAGGGRRQLMGLLLALGLVSGLVILYAETKRVHWPGEGGSLLVRNVVDYGLEGLGMAWTITKLVVMGRN